MTAYRLPTLPRVAGAVPAAAIIVVFLVFPLLFIAFYSFMVADPYGGVEWELSLDAYRRFLFEEDLMGNLTFDSGYLSIFGRSFAVATGATLLSVIIAFPVAYYMAMQPPERQTLLVFLVTIPFWTNLLIRTYAWILILRDTGLANTALMNIGAIDEPVRMLYTNWAVLAGLVYMYIPFMVLPIYASLSRLDLRLLEAGHDLYATRWRVLREITIPLATPGILAGGILVFIPSIGNFVAPALLGGGKNLMIGTLVQLQFSSGRSWPFGSACALILLAIVMTILITIGRRRARSAIEAGV